MFGQLMFGTQGFTSLGSENLLIAIEEVSYNGDKYLDSPASLLSLIKAQFITITDFTFSSISISREINGSIISPRQVINVNNALYKGRKYLSESWRNTLQTALESKLANISGLVYARCVINSSRSDWRRVT